MLKITKLLDKSESEIGNDNNEVVGFGISIFSDVKLIKKLGNQKTINCLSFRKRLSPKIVKKWKFTQIEY